VAGTSLEEYQPRRFWFVRAAARRGTMAVNSGGVLGEARLAPWLLPLMALICYNFASLKKREDDIRFAQGRVTLGERKDVQNLRND